MIVIFLVAFLAQTLTVIVKPAIPFQVSWDQPAEPVPVHFRWWCEGAIVKNFATSEPVPTIPPNPDGTTTYTATVPGLPQGQHSCLVSSYNDVGESKSPPIPITVGTLPGTPLRLKVIVTIGG